MRFSFGHCFPTLKLSSFQPGRPLVRCILSSTVCVRAWTTPSLDYQGFYSCDSRRYPQTVPNITRNKVTEWEMNPQLAGKEQLALDRTPLLESSGVLCVFRLPSLPWWVASSFQVDQLSFHLKTQEQVEFLSHLL